MKRLSLLTLVFAVVSVVFFLLLIFFRTPFGPYPLMSVQDALDILTPLVLIPIYWLMLRYAIADGPSRGEEIAFSVLSALWVEGQGIHLAANSIDNLIEGLAEKNVIDVTGTDIYELTYFMDEHLSHYMWHIGVLGLAALLVWRAWRRPAGVDTNWWATTVGGILYGFTCFCIFVEGQTVPLGFPFAALVTVVMLVWGRKKLAGQPVLAFFFVAFLVATLLFTGYGIAYKGWPEFTKVGLI